MTTTLPPEARARAAVLYQSGASIRAIAEALGESYGRVRNGLIDAGVPLRPRGRPRTSPAPAGAVQPPRSAPKPRPRRPFPLEKATAMYEAGKTLRQIASKTGYSRSRVHVFLTDAGVEMRTTKHPRASRITAAKRRAILQGFRAGRSHAEIIAQVRTTTATIHRVVSDAGLEPRRQTRKYDHDRMKRLRHVEGWTLAAVAADQGTTPQYVWTIVNGCHLKSYVRRGRRRAHAVPAEADAT
ncbi:helix-turn-helix domain-containing protein [Nonomuraea purpurea]|uniref:Helix-turn-helix domain-containing protein n=1 Tax=Nonomuraea purpurea TaxID=1849276 RepID=A0ABV8GKZ7_9ACTN